MPNNFDVITFLADDAMVFNKDDLSSITILRQETKLLSQKVFA